MQLNEPSPAPDLSGRSRREGLERLEAGSGTSTAFLATRPTRTRRPNYVPELLLTLDGEKYGVTWVAGATAIARIGRGVHKRIIEWFRDNDSHPAVAL